MAIKTATMVLYMTEVDEVVYTETPEYGMEEGFRFLCTKLSFEASKKAKLKNFLSDVGGTAGLILGMSFATVIGLIDILLQQTFKFIVKYAGIGKKVTMDMMNTIKVCWIRFILLSFTTQGPPLTTSATTTSPPPPYNARAITDEYVKQLFPDGVVRERAI